jgi:hypothetical protein
MAEDLEEQLTQQLATVLNLGEDHDSYDVVPYMASMLASDEDMIQDKSNFDETIQDLLVRSIASAVAVLGSFRC